MTFKKLTSAFISAALFMVSMESIADNTSLKAEKVCSDSVFWLKEKNEKIVLEYTIGESEEIHKLPLDSKTQENEYFFSRDGVNGYILNVSSDSSLKKHKIVSIEQKTNEEIRPLSCNN